MPTNLQYNSINNDNSQSPYTPEHNRHHHQEQSLNNTNNNNITPTHYHQQVNNNNYISPLQNNLQQHQNMITQGGSSVPGMTMVSVSAIPLSNNTIVPNLL